MKTVIRKRPRLLRAALLLPLLGLQGGLAGAWVPVVGLDSSRTSDVTFAPFEHSWVAEASGAPMMQSQAAFRRIAVIPFEGDAAMSSRMAHVLDRHMQVHVVSPTSATQGELLALAEQGADCQDAAGRERIAQAVGRDLQVDSVLVGHVQAAPAEPGAWGWKDREERRLYLYLLSHRGEVLWKDELPFTVVKGSKPPLEEAVVGSLAEHVLSHASTVGLTNLGLFPRRTS
ncbi:MAG: hypothetical protein U0231_00030 [Nitrospiraceae bacterium]